MNQKQMSFLQALLTQPNISAAAKKAGISRSTAYKYLNNEEFKAELRKSQDECISDTVRFLQGKLAICSARLAKIAVDPATPSQVAINACNAIFTACKNLTETNEIMVRLQQLEELLKSAEEGDEL